MYAMLATADEPRYYFDLPPLRADQALNRLGQQADRQILYPYEMARRSQANRVIGEFTFEEALQTLLEGSGLRVVVSQTGDFAIVEDQSVTRQKEMSSVNKNSGLLAMLGALLASGTPDASVAQERGLRVLEEVHITARRVQESLQDTPVSVTVRRWKNGIFSAAMRWTRSPPTCNSPTRPHWLATTPPPPYSFAASARPTQPLPLIQASGSISMMFTWASRSVARWISAILPAFRCCVDRRARCSAKTRSAVRFC
jgi:hypothetical protein